MEDFTYWPFPIGISEMDLNEFQRDFIDWMQIAFAEGYRPRHRTESAIEADSAIGRSIFLVLRGRRNGWEPWLADVGQSIRLGPFYGLPLGSSACVCIRPPFRAVGYFALEWLRGRPLEALLSEFEFVGGSPAGIQLRQELLSKLPAACPPETPAPGNL